ncbi:zinc-binding dehydrogenase [Oleiphilus messinensis]|uniref:zinc-binding dehydrogenase n=1 Tax=Oleiphilus messinensis TaxID=141451 RepID=UPI0018E04D0F|nr:zinc-binding dehydrogenase [Oleiphilus messinensis]
MIRIKAFGLNRAETYMRKGQWGEVALVSGIECVGIIEQDPQNILKQGQKVVALMGGLGRTINGSYAEYTVVPRLNVIPVDTNLSWPELAAIPETYCTAWYCLHQNLKITEGRTLFIRGGTSALGLAAINIAKNIEGVKVLASTRNSGKEKFLHQQGVNQVYIEEENLSERIRESFPEGLDAVLDLVGNSTLIDSLKIANKGGHVCNAGFLGGQAPLSFNPLIDLPSGVNLNFFASFMFGTVDFPLSDIPFAEILLNVSSGKYKAEPSHVFGFHQLPDAHRQLESNLSNGKLVVEL